MTTTQQEHIIDAALQLFAERGYRATTMTDIGSAIGVRGPSLYKHIGSKQEILVRIMTRTMNGLMATHRTAVAGCEDTTERLRRAVESHVRFHVRHRREAYVGTREIRSLEEPNRRHIVNLRNRYERAFRKLIEQGCLSHDFHVASAKLASYSILDLGMGTSVWYREDGDLTEDEIVYQYGEFALRLIGARRLRDTDRNTDRPAPATHRAR